MDARTIIIHGLADAQATIARDPEVILRSAPGAVGYAGALWWRELMRILRDEHGWRGLALLDCGGQAAYAVEAIHCGVTHLIFDRDSGWFDEISNLAVAAGGVVWEGGDGIARPRDSSSSGPQTSVAPS